MSMQYCHDCDKNIDLDHDSEHEHFKDETQIGKCKYCEEPRKKGDVNCGRCLNKFPSEDVVGSEPTKQKCKHCRDSGCLNPKKCKMCECKKFEAEDETTDKQTDKLQMKQQKGCGEVIYDTGIGYKVLCGDINGNFCESCSNQSQCESVEVVDPGEKNSAQLDSNPSSGTFNLSDKRLFVHAKTFKNGKKGITWGGWVISDYHVKEAVKNCMEDIKLWSASSDNSQDSDDIFKKHFGEKLSNG